MPGKRKFNPRDKRGIYLEGNVMEEDPQEEQTEEELNIAIPLPIRRIVESYCEFYNSNAGRDRPAEQPLIRAREQEPTESAQTQLNRERLQNMSTQLFSQLNKINHCKTLLLSNLREEFSKINMMRRASLCAQCKVCPYSFVINRCGHTVCEQCSPAHNEPCPVCSLPVEAVLEFNYTDEH